MARSKQERKAARAQRVSDRRAARAESRATRQSARSSGGSSAPPRRSSGPAPRRSSAPARRTNTPVRREAQPYMGARPAGGGRMKSIDRKADRRARREETRPLANQQVDNASDYKFDAFRANTVNTTELRNLRSQGHSREDIRAAAEGSGLRFGKAAERRLDRWDAKAKARADARERAQDQIADPLPAIETQQPAPSEPPPRPVVEPPETVTTPSVPTPVYEPPDGGGGPSIPEPDIQITTPKPVPTYPGDNTNVNPVQDNDQIQQIDQDNDVNTDIDGDNNYVDIDQDNSIRQYGGDNRQFTYVGGNGGNGGPESPASMATLGGYWDVSDSPAKQAAFVDLHTTLNRDNQKRYAGEGISIAQGAIHRAMNDQTINTNALDKRIYEREMYSRAKSDMMGMNLFGDMYKGTAPNWTSPERQEGVETPDFEKMYDTYTDF